jgi:hypothetical protein
VRHGGSKEPSIQLAGGPPAQASPERNATNQMWGTVDANLKKISGRQLSSTDQDTVTQIHRFMDQSKAAAAEGDYDRAKNLAWKAQLLSQDLVKP